MKKVMAFGTFDIFHKGHISFLQQARQYGDYLITVIARDRTVEKIKRKLPTNNEKERLKKVKESRLADQVVLGKLRDKYQVIKDFGPDVICLGYDQKGLADNLQEKLDLMGLRRIKIVRLKSYKPEVYKSSKLRRRS